MIASNAAASHPPKAGASHPRRCAQAFLSRANTKRASRPVRPSTTRPAMTENTRRLNSLVPTSFIQLWISKKYTGGCSRTAPRR